MKSIFVLLLLWGSITANAQTDRTMKHSERYERGWKKLQEIDGEAGERVLESLKDIAPELAQYRILLRGYLCTRDLVLTREGNSGCGGAHCLSQRSPTA